MKNPDWVFKQFHLLPSSSERIQHEDTLSSEVYRVKLKNQTPGILKLFYRTVRYRKEKYYLNLVKNTIPVPHILGSLDPEKDFHGALLLEEIPGEILKAKTLTDECAFQLGAILARLHTIPVPSFGDLSLPHPQRTTTTPLELMRNYLESSFSECKHIVDGQLLNRCAEYAESNLSLFLDAEGPCIAHRDFRPGNAIAYQGTVRAIIDFENAMGSFPEEDFAQMQMLAWNDYPHSRPPFLKGYATVRPLPERLEEILPLMCMLKALGAVGFTCERKTWEKEHADVFARNLAYLSSFHGSPQSKNNTLGI